MNARVRKQNLHYHIADAMIDFTHVFWIGFFWLPLGTVAIGVASVFGQLRQTFDEPWASVTMALLAILPALCLKLGWRVPYTLCRLGSMAFFSYLAYLCLEARPISTGCIYSVHAGAALVLILKLWYGESTEV